MNIAHSALTIAFVVQQPYELIKNIRKAFHYPSSIINY